MAYMRWLGMMKEDEIQSELLWKISNEKERLEFALDKDEKTNTVIQKKHGFILQKEKI